MYKPRIGNVPIDKNQCTNSPNPLYRPLGQIHSETSKNPVVCASRTDPGSQKNIREEDPKSIASAATVLKKLRTQLGMSADEARRERKYSREIKAAGLDEEIDE